MKPNGSRMVTVLGTRVHVVAQGSGAPVVLCGGLAGTWHDWIEVSALLVRAGYTAVVVERPGFGLSEPLPAGRVPTTADEARRIAAVLDALSITEPAIVVGHSMAGFYVEAFIRMFPARAAGMVLLDSSVEKSPSALFPRRLRVPAAKVWARIASATGAQWLFADLTRRVLTQAVPPDGYAPERIDDLRRVYRRRTYLEAASVEYALYADLAEELNVIRRSTSTPDLPIAVAAAHTGHRTPWGARWLRRQQRLARYLHGTFAIVSPSHHHAMIDQPGRVVGLIEAVDRRG